MAEEPKPGVENARGAPPNLVDLLVRIPMFNDLVPAECRKILSACSHAVFAEGHVIYEAGSPGNQMLILLRGTVQVLSADGKPITAVQWRANRLVDMLAKTAL